MKIRRNYFALEGLNGAGKSTINKIIENEKKDEYVFFHDPAIEFDPKKNPYGKDLSSDDKLSSKLYLISSYLTQKKYLNELNDEAKIIFSDRSVISTCAYYESLDPQWIKEAHKHCFFPSIVFLVTADEHSTELHLSSRESDKNELEIEIKSNEGLMNRYLNISKIFNKIKFIEIKNIEGNPYEPARIIMNYIEEYYECN